MLFFLSFAFLQSPASWPQPCTAGSYCPQPNAGSVSPCPANEFCTIAGLSRAYPKPYCTAGNYLVGTTCTTCPAGHFCLGESWTSVAVPCAAGTYQTATGQSTCSTCTQGNFCANGGSAISAMTPCPEGSYCPSGGMTAAIACSPGFYTIGTGQLAQVRRHLQCWEHSSCFEKKSNDRNMGQAMRN
jgi:hypothetical protein